MLDHFAVMLRPARADDEEFAFEVKRDAMGVYIIARWGWDEDFQRKFHARRWADKPWSIICRDDQRVGTVSLHWYPTHLQFGEFYIAAAHRRRGFRVVGENDTHFFAARHPE